MAYHYVYILGSSEEGVSRHYTGRTCLLPEDRLRDHNAGRVSHTAKYRPWHLQTYIAFGEESKAIAFERYLKSGSGREFARRHF